MSIKLIVPANISTTPELFRGFSYKAVRNTAVITLTVVAAAIAYVQLIDPQGTILATGAVLFTIFACVGYFKKIPEAFNSSMHEYICRLIRFYKGQKNYYYKKR